MRVATDIGGTFTDLIYLDEATGEVGLTKASTTPHNFALGVEDTLKKSGLNVADTTFFVQTRPSSKDHSPTGKHKR